MRNASGLVRGAPRVLLLVPLLCAGFLVGRALAYAVHGPEFERRRAVAERGEALELTRAERAERERLYLEVGEAARLDRLAQAEEHAQRRGTAPARKGAPEGATGQDEAEKRAQPRRPPAEPQNSDEAAGRDELLRAIGNLERELARVSDYVRRLERRITVLEGRRPPADGDEDPGDGDADPPGRDDEDPPGRDDEEPPPPVDGRFPSAEPATVLVRVTGDALERIHVPAPTARDWTVEGPYRWAEVRQTVEGLELRLWWEAWHGASQSYLTAALANAYPGVGIVDFDRVAVLNGRETLFDYRTDTLPPGYAFLESDRPATPEGWDWIPDGRTFPPWSEEAARADLANRASRVLGNHPLWWADTNPGAPAGFGIAPFHGGLRDWLVGPWGKANRWGETLAEGWKGPLWRIDRQTGDPLVRPVPYWQGRDAANQAAGYVWSPRPGRALDADLWSRGRLPDGYHFRRCYGAPTAIARYSAPARFLCRLLWADVEQAWNNAPDAPTSSNPLLMPLWQRTALARGAMAPPAYNPWGDRGLGHAQFVLAECSPWLDPDKVEEYAAAFAAFSLAIHDGAGVCNRSVSGDTGQLTGPPWNLRGPLCSTFHQRLVLGSLDALVLFCGRRELQTLADAGRTFLGPGPATPYAVEVWIAGRPGDRYQDRRHSAMGTLAPSQRKYAPGGDYGSFTHGVLAGYPDLESMDATARGMSVNSDVQPYDAVPRAVWAPLWEDR